MKSYRILTAKQPHRPAIVDRFEHIAVQFDDSGRPTYFAALSNGSGAPVCVPLRPLELRHFPLLQTVLLNRLGVRFDDRGLYSGRRGQDRWETYLYELLGEELPA